MSIRKHQFFLCDAHVSYTAQYGDKEIYRRGDGRKTVREDDPGGTVSRSEERRSVSLGWTRGQAAGVRQEESGGQEGEEEMTIDERLENMRQQLELLTQMQKDSIRRTERAERRFQRLRQAMVHSMNDFMTRLEDEELNNGDDAQSS